MKLCMIPHLPVRPIRIALLLVWAFSIISSTIVSSAAALPAGALASARPAADLWVDGVHGNDGSDGLTRTTAFRSIQRAADLAAPGSVVHILPGIYREMVRPVQSGEAGRPIVYRAEDGPGTVILRGSEQAGSLAWTRLDANRIGLPSSVDPANLYVADLSGWGLSQRPRFIVRFNAQGNVASRLPLAREPDWQPGTGWKYAEFWWAADGGYRMAGCDPASNWNRDCDLFSRSTTQLLDRLSDSQPAGIEPGNLTTLGNLTGATLVALDTNEGHYLYRRKIIADDVNAGIITLNRPAEFDSGSGRAGLGWGSKYYVEDHPALLDNPGEWWFDAATSRLYLWPPAAGSPATQNLEISRRDAGFILSERSYITLDGLTIELFNNNAVVLDNDEKSHSYNDTVQNVTLRYANVGVEVGQSAEGPAANITDGFTLQGSQISHMDSMALHFNYWWPGAAPETFTFPGIVNTLIRNNEMYDLGFRTDSDNADGIQFNHPDRLRFEGNYVHDVAHNGIIIGGSVIQSTKDGGFTPDEIKTGQILIKDNVVERACLLASDCGALKIEGGPPREHIYRDFLITGNVFRNSFGWTYIAEKRQAWSGGTGSQVRGMGGFGLYADFAGGFYIYRNIAYNNAWSGFHFYNSWWQSDLVLYNNIAANSLNGVYLGGDTEGSANTQIANNIILNNEAYGILMFPPHNGYGSFVLDHNLYDDNGWRPYAAGGLEQAGDLALNSPSDFYQTLAGIQAGTRWESQGVEGDPAFWSYNAADHSLFDASWPDFHLTSASLNVLDKGTASLPAGLARLLTEFGIQDLRRGAAYDIGRYEGGFGILESPAVQFVSPCEPARYTLRLAPADLPHEVALSVESPSPYLQVRASASSLGPGEELTLTVAESPLGSLFLPPGLYAVALTARGGGFEETTSVRALIGHARTGPRLPARGVCLALS